MRVKMHFVCPEIFGTLPNGSYDFPDGGTIQDCTERCALEHGSKLPDGWFDRVLFMKDNKPARKDDTAEDGSYIIVTRMILGG